MRQSLRAGRMIGSEGERQLAVSGGGGGRNGSGESETQAAADAVPLAGLLTSPCPQGLQRWASVGAAVGRSVDWEH